MFYNIRLQHDFIISLYYLAFQRLSVNKPLQNSAKRQ